MTTKICFLETCFEVEIAKTFLQKIKGLMFREYLPQSSGMLFVFNSEAHRTFWMAFVKFPLDFIFLNSDKEIVYIERNALPCRGLWCKLVNSPLKAQYVLEINAGLADKLGLKLGDRSEIYL